MKSKAPKVTIPEYRKPTPTNFQNTYGMTQMNDGVWSFNPNQQGIDENNQIQALKNSILQNLGVTSDARQAGVDKFRKTFFDEANRLSQPQLEQSLFARGLGGSNFYQGSLNDLLAKNSTNAILNAENLNNMDQQMQLSQLGSIQGLSNDYNNRIDNLLQLAAQNYLSEQGLAQQQYATTLPYLATVSQKKSPLGSIGSVLGAGAGFALGGPVGAGIGSSIGGGIGGAVGGSPSQIDLSSLALLGGGGGYNFSGMSALPNNYGIISPKLSGFGGAF